MIKYLITIITLMVTTVTFSQQRIQHSTGQFWFIDTTSGDTVQVEVSGDNKFLLADTTVLSIVNIGSTSVYIDSSWVDGDTLKVQAAGVTYNMFKPGSAPGSAGGETNTLGDMAGSGVGLAGTKSGSQLRVNRVYGTGGLTVADSTDSVHFFITGLDTSEVDTTAFGNFVRNHQSSSSSDSSFIATQIDTINEFNSDSLYIINEVKIDSGVTIGGDLDAQGNNIIDLANVTFQTGASGGTIRTGTSNADKFQLQVYDVNDGAYRDAIELDAGNSPTMTFNLDKAADLDINFSGGTDTNLMFFDSSADSVGIGKTSPQAKLDVDGDFQATSANITGNITVSGTVDGKDIATNAGMLNEAETISANWVNTANPWAENELVSTVLVESDQNAGTDITADLEEETHASEHEDGGADEIDLEGLDATADSDTFKIRMGTSSLYPLDLEVGDSRIWAVDSTGIHTFAVIGTPTTDADGEFTVDSDAWAAGRDAIEFYDGTASTYLIGTLASDTPTDGQVPKWNTGGTITWEDDGTGSGAYDSTTVLAKFDTLEAFNSNTIVFNDTTKFDSVVYFYEQVNVFDGSNASPSVFFINQNEDSFFLNTQTDGTHRIQTLTATTDTLEVINTGAGTLDLYVNGGDISAGVIFLAEQADAEADVAGKGQFWVNTAVPNEPYFTDDAGNDRALIWSGGAFHDGFSDFVSNEHIDHSGVTLTAGNGLSGGGDITANRSFALDVNELGAETAIAAGDFIVMEDITDNGSQKITFSNFEGDLTLSNLSGYVANEHIDHTSVTLTAGDGLGGGGDISSNRTFTVNVHPDSAILITNDSLRINVDDASINIASNAIQVKDGGITKAKLAVSTDFGDVSTDGSSNLTLDANTVDNTAMADDAIGSAEMADEDHGDVSWSAGVATVDAVTVSDDESTADAHEVVFTTDNSILESDGDLNYNPSSGTLASTVFSGSGASLTNLDVNRSELNADVPITDTVQIEIPFSIFDTTSTPTSVTFESSGKSKRWTFAASTRDTLLLTDPLSLPDFFSAWVGWSFTYTAEQTGADTLVVMTSPIAHDEVDDDGDLSYTHRDTLVSATGPAANDSRLSTELTTFNGTFAAEDKVWLAIERLPGDAGVMNMTGSLKMYYVRTE